MRSWTSRFGACGIAVAAALAGCGGNVVVDGDPGGEGGGANGGGSGDGGGTTTPTGTTTTSTTTTTTTIDPNDLTPACLAYCNEVGNKGCFEVTECQARCMGYYVEGCALQLEAVLACLPPSLNDFCQIVYPANGDGCDPVLGELGSCINATFGECSGSAGLIGDSACKGEAECPGFDLEVACDETGLCTCSKDGSAIGVCGMPFSGNEPCAAYYSCCREFLWSPI